ncbi:MAG: DUF2802 domain-containing protein [bacterium]|nr:DUF2802 domain-containing protein [bacterium]
MSNSVVLWFLVINIIVTATLYWRLIKRYSERIRQDNNEENDHTYQKMIQLITEFNRTSNANIDILEGKTEELRKEIENASIKIDQLRKLNKESEKEVVFLEIKEEEKVKKEENLEETNSDRYDLANNLIRQGLTIDEVAKRVKLSRSEIELAFQLRKS